MKLWLAIKGLAGAIAVVVFGCASSTAQQPPAATAPPAVVETPIAGFPHAKVYRTSGADARPVLVIMGGAEGNDDGGRRFGPVFARLGYTAVSFPYYSPSWGSFAPPAKLPELPGSFIDIRIERVAELRDALKAIPGADVSRFGILSGSKGSEFSLSAASRYDWITSIVAYTPSDLVWEGFGLEMIDHEGTRSSFSFDGKPLAFMPYRGFVEWISAGSTGSLRAVHENGRADFPDREAAARIPIERYKGELMLIAGERDAQWNSARMARNIVASREAAGLKTEALIYPEGGHGIVGGDGVRDVDPRSGGTRSADAAARQDAWPKVLAFLSRTLRPAGANGRAQ